MKVYAIRGATCAKANTKQEIIEKTVELAKKIVENNKFDSIVSIISTTTPDITAYYPVKAIRESGIMDGVFFSCAEPQIENDLKFCIRLLITVSSNDDSVNAKHIYLEEARNLRKDLD